jgi:hypothetical protein
MTIPKMVTSRLGANYKGVDMRRKEDFLSQNVGGQAFLVPLGAKVRDMNGMILLNATGSYIWDLMAEDRSVDELAAAVAARFGVNRERAHVDVQAFVEEVIRQGLVDP